MSTCKEKVKSQTLTPIIKSSLSPLSPLISLILFLILSSQVFATDYDNEANFTKIYSGTINGDIAATGSPIMCAKKSNGTCDWDYPGYLYDIDPLTLHDGNTTTFPLNSGGAILKLPNNVTGADIVWARLYWQGHIFGLGDTSDFNNAISSLNSVKMLDSNDIEHNLTAKSSDIYYYGYDNKSVYNNKSKGYRYFYQASVDITGIIKNSYSSTNNYFIVGDIDATMTKDTYYIKDTKLDAYVKWGNWGGWSLIVAYKDPNSSLKNINLYDGFKFLLPPFGTTASLTINLPPNSFYTPQFGTVNSKTIMFSAGAEKKISADSLEMYSNKNGGGYLALYNSLNPSNNQMNDSITYLNQEINSTRIFNAGIDLDTYDSSNILDNGQTTTSIKVTMTANAQSADQAFVGFIGISNDIYQPKICYNETLYDSNGTALTSNSKLTVGDTMQSKLTIKNDDNETAVDVKITHSFEDNKTIYDSNSTTINNMDANGSLLGDANQTDLYGDDLVDFNSTSKKLIIRLGRNATATQGGSFQPSDTVHTTFKSTINKDQNISLSYETSYAYSIAGQNFTFNGPLPKCTDFDNTIQAYLPPIGTFNVTNQYANLSSGDPTNTKDIINALFTQIAGKYFNVTIVSLDVDKKTLKSYDKDLNVSIISSPSYESNTTQNQVLCNEAGESVSHWDNISFENQSSKILNIKSDIAISNASFIVQYQTLDTNGNQNKKYVCSRDNFAIRPATYSFDMNETHLIGGKWYKLDSNATNNINDANVSGYNPTVDTNLSLIVPAGCTLSSDKNSTSTKFADGSYNNVFVRSSNIGDYNISILDTNWTSVDQKIYNGKNYDDCIQNSSSNTPNIGGKVGCDISGNKVFSFSPKAFKNTLSVSDFGNNFTYDSNTSDMSAHVDINITAILEGNTTATNYTAKCYSKDTNTTLKLITNPANYPDANKTIIFFDDNNSTHKESNSTSQATFSTSEGNFTSGVANIHMHFNFDRNISKAINPFKVGKNDFNITNTIDTNGTNGSDFNRTIDQNTTFYYGRVHAPDYRFKGNVGNATIYYEVYSDQNKSIRNSFGITGTESVDSINWYVNTLHTNSDGNVSKFVSIGNSTVNGNQDTEPSGTIANGKETKSIAHTAPYKDKIDISNSSSWLHYNPTDFIVEFYKGGGWAGQGIQGKTVDLNISTIQNKRLDW